MDIELVVAAVGFFAASWGLVMLCGRQAGPELAPNTKTQSHQDTRPVCLPSLSLGVYVPWCWLAPQHKDSKPPRHETCMSALFEPW